MKIEIQQRGDYLLIHATGRLDVSWADYFSDTLLLQIRKGHHYLVIDASEMAFLSSAGVRALVLIFKELNMVRGRLIIVNPTAFVEQTLSTSGFQMWLAKELPEDMPAAVSGDEADHGDQEPHAGIQRFTIHEKAELTVSQPAAWRPWQVVKPNMSKALSFTQDSFALGIASAAGSFEEARDHFGEFLAVGGNVVFQPPDEVGSPDYLIAAKHYIPRMQCIQVLHCSGDMRHLIRFSPTAKTSFYTLSTLAGDILDQTDGAASGFVMLGEIEGLVGTALIRSPGRITSEQEIHFPEIRDWLTFCGERSYSHQQALLTGVVCKAGVSRLAPMPSHSDIAVHIHAAVFPYQPLQNGKIGLHAAVAKFFDGPPPMAVMHLADDVRPIVGLAESALIRGACWFGPLQNPEVLS